MQKITYLLIAFSMLITTLFGQAKNTAFSDFFNNDKSPAFNREMIIDIKGDSIAAYAFIADGKKLKETIILLHGLPGNDNQHDIAQSLRRTGRNVIHFNYRGSWGSQGEFLYANSLEDVDEIIEYLSQPKTQKTLRIKPNAFVLLGRSFGGGIALIKGSTNKKVKKIIAISSMNAGTRFKENHDKNDLKGWEDYLNKQIMLNVNPNEFLNEMIINRNIFNVITYKEHLKNKKVLIIEDTKNNFSWIKKLTNIDYKLIKSDHSFISNRIHLTNTIINWLNKK